MTNLPQTPLIDQPAVQGTVVGASLMLGVLSLLLGWQGAEPMPPRVDGPLLRIDLNTAGEQELALLPGIGPATAKAIVADRVARGPFATTDDLDRVRGIGLKTIAEIRPYVDLPAVSSASQTDSTDAGKRR